MGVPILIGFFTKKDAARQSGSVQDSMMTAYHDLFFISFILSVTLYDLTVAFDKPCAETAGFSGAVFALSCGLCASLCPIHKAKTAPEKPAVSAQGLSKATVKSYKVINDTEYRNALRNLQK